MDPTFPQDCDAVKAKIDDPATGPLDRANLQALYDANCGCSCPNGPYGQSGGVPIKHPPHL